MSQGYLVRVRLVGIFARFGLLSAANMSSFAAKKRSTLLTRKKTKKRLARLGLDASYSAGQMKRETVYPGNKRFKYGACDTITRKAVSFADDVNPESALVAHHVRIIIDGNKRKEAAAQLYLDVRREEASRRRKELIVFVMDGDRAVLRTPKLLRLTQIWKRVTSNRHKEINSGKQKAVSYKGCRLLHSQLKKAQIKDILAEIKSGKTSLLITHDAVCVVCSCIFCMFACLRTCVYFVCTCACVLMYLSCVYFMNVLMYVLDLCT